MEKGPSPADREPPQAETEMEAETEDPWKGHAIIEKGFKLFD
jgi:hypothetical protein